MGRKIKNIVGNDISNPPYLIKRNQEKAYHDHEKEAVLREIWEEIYTQQDIEENAQTEAHVREYLNEKFHRTSPYHYGDNTTLNTDNDFLNFNYQITNIIKNMKNICPGKSEINNTILSHLPEEAITRLKNIQTQLCLRVIFLVNSKQQK